MNQIKIIGGDVPNLVKRNTEHFTTRRNQSLPVALSMIFFLSGCDYVSTQQRHTLFNASSGDTYKIDHSSGKVFLLTNDREIQLRSSTPVLKVGFYYEMEDAENGKKYLKYLGNGKFEASEYAVIKKNSK